MEVSDQYSATHSASASPDSAFIASVNASTIQIRSTTSFEVIRTINLPEEKINSPSLRWSPLLKTKKSNRLLITDGETIRVYDLRDTKWKAVIQVGSAGTGKFVNVEFGLTDDEIMAFSDFGSKVTIWSLSTGRNVEIKDPKFSSPRGYGFRPRTGELCLLSRPNAQDIATIHDPATHEVLKTVDLATIDAQGIKWSADGRWFLTWDTPSAGSRLYVYTADGHLYRMYGGDHESDFEGLGIRNAEWSSRGDYLAISGYSKKITLLSTRTFSPTVVLEHTTTIQLPSGDVWQEQVSGTGERKYEAAVQPVAPPTADEKITTTPSISLIAFNADGSLLATKDDTTPTAIWLWDLTQLTPKTVLLIYSPVRTFSWHPTNPILLLAQSIEDEPSVHIWYGQQPTVLQTSFKRAAGRFDCKWLNTRADRKPAIICSDNHGHLILWPEGRDQILRFDRSSSPNGAEESDDSLFDILTGRTPVRAPSSTVMLEREADEEQTEALDDTFRHKRGVHESFTDSEFF